ncbi:MAG TPA: PadR family transcriptional regulator [Solirubrobacteraceae bacterium]|nr:PadR family transcriptional regulator [Solirubrobacteraceae bacterium]
MALRHVLLGLLADRPDHGYSLKRRLSPGLPAERLINDGILYPLLRRLEDEGLLTSRSEQHAGRERRRFSTTARGRREFLAWLHSDADEDCEPTYELYTSQPLVKLLFGDDLSERERNEKLVRHADGIRERLATLERLRALVDPAERLSLGAAWLQLELAAEGQRLAGIEALLAAPLADNRPETEAACMT